MGDAAKLNQSCKVVFVNPHCLGREGGLSLCRRVEKAQEKQHSPWRVSSLKWRLS